MEGFWVLICVRHFLVKSSYKPDFSERPIFFHASRTCSDLPSHIGPVVSTVTKSSIFSLLISRNLTFYRIDFPDSDQDLLER